MKFSATYSLALASLANLSAAQADCATNISALESVGFCLSGLNADYTTQTVNTVALYSGACSYQKAAIGCATSFCGDTFPSMSAWETRSSIWCKGGATATPTATSAASGTKASASAAVTGAKSTAGAGAGANGFGERGVLLAAAAGLVGAVL